ncbi:MAG: hypothetical protein BJ554DRAFT_5976 [Olpidium bornovanus]|uniref:Uncharacterized protein n=1 Tax=Olpidium bornovanus TaxID=278681 RepID=A0A8H7ZYQ3_9FUNG|nr:MAG: hypothetical protein BJ554DRAFT_5976 [Olpidium bornovanus]
MNTSTCRPDRAQAPFSISDGGSGPGTLVAWTRPTDGSPLTGTVFASGSWITSKSSSRRAPAASDDMSVSPSSSRVA